MLDEFNVGPPYWMRDIHLVNGGNPANAKSRKEK